MRMRQKDSNIIVIVLADPFLKLYLHRGLLVKIEGQENKITGVVDKIQLLRQNPLWRLQVISHDQVLKKREVEPVAGMFHLFLYHKYLLLHLAFILQRFDGGQDHLLDALPAERF